MIGGIKCIVVLNVDTSSMKAMWIHRKRAVENIGEFNVMNPSADVLIVVAIM
jgi:hypothetical protein